MLKDVFFMVAVLLQDYCIQSYCHLAADGNNHAIHIERDLPPAWAQPDLGRALCHIDAAWIGDVVDDRRSWMLERVGRQRGGEPLRIDRQPPQHHPGDGRMVPAGVDVQAARHVGGDDLVARVGKGYPSADRASE